MKLHLISDLHTEFLTYGQACTLVNDICNIGCDVRVLAGDIGCTWMTKAFLEHLAYKSKPPVIFVPGNHDHYKKDADHYLSELIAQNSKQGTNLHVLQRETVTLFGQRFVGCTAWYTCIPHKDMINDATEVTYAKQNVPILGRRDRDYLEETVYNTDVVITHYVPHVRSIAPQYAGTDNRYFLVPYEDLIEERKPRLWLHGHTHTACDYTLSSGTRIVCNPRGYPGERTGFSMKKTIRL